MKRKDAKKRRRRRQDKSTTKTQRHKEDEEVEKIKINQPQRHEDTKKTKTQTHRGETESSTEREAIDFISSTALQFFTSSPVEKISRLTKGTRCNGLIPGSSSLG
jgi:hypothetical protein